MPLQGEAEQVRAMGSEAYGGRDISVHVTLARGLFLHVPGPEAFLCDMTAIIKLSTRRGRGLRAERQKLRRIIKRYKKKLSDETLKASKRAKMEGELEEARVLLNYILHFP